MNKISELPFPFKARINQYAVRQQIAKQDHKREFSAAVNQVESISTFRLIISVVAAVIFAVLLTLSLAAVALCFVT